jgi:hypothetical protein
MQKHLIRIAILLPWLTIGCARENAGSPGSESPAIAVDASLPKEAQERQRIIRSALFSLKEGYPIERLKAFLPGVTFAETEAQFLDGAKYLESWQWGGQPSGDEVPVSLFFTFEGSTTAKQIDRVYVVKGKPGRYTVTRK